MARHNGLHSPNVRKSAGSITYTVWKGIPVAKQKVTQVRNPQTAPQMIQRSRMKALSQLGSLALKAINLGFINQAKQKTPFNVFTSTNMAAVTGNATGPATIDWPLLQFSRGNLEGFTGITNLDVTGDDVSIDFDAPLQGNPDFNDSGVMVVFRENGSPVIAIEDDFSKNAGTASVTMPTLNAGEILHVWLFGRNADTGVVSNTLYGGSVTV